MHSINHQGPFFDNLTFSNFGYGGDPNDVSRLHVDKDKWYDFRALFRRDKNFWNYDLLANPLNPTTGPIPNGAVVNSPHALDLVPPDARLRSDSFAPIAAPVPIGLFAQRQYRPRFHHHRGRDRAASLADRERRHQFLPHGRGLPRSPQDHALLRRMLTYSTINNSVTDSNFPYQLSNGTPVDMGIVSVGTSPCAITAATPPTVSPLATPICPIARSRIPRSSFPVERFSFQSTYVKNLAMSGSASYSGGHNDDPRV